MGRQKKNKIVNSVHEQTVEWLVERLMASGKFDTVQEDIPYAVGRSNGQIDVMAVINDGQKNIHYFYEVKSSCSSKTRRKAQSQYDRYRSCHEHQTLEGYFVTPRVIERLQG